MNSDPKQKRERFQQLTQNPKVKTGKAFAAELRKSKVHPTVKKLTAWRKLNRLSQRKAVVVLAQYYFHATFASLRSWEEGRRSPNSHTAAIQGPNQIGVKISFNGRIKRSRALHEFLSTFRVLFIRIFRQQLNGLPSRTGRGGSGPMC